LFHDLVLKGHGFNRADGLFHDLVLKGHGFSRAAGKLEKLWALAPEGKLENRQPPVMKQLVVRAPLRVKKWVLQ
jgi:hypothetical protein